jgi:hypothetical protein
VSRRRPRVPATYGDRLRRLLAVTTEHAEPGCVYVARVEHDPDCPAVQRQSLAACRCDPTCRPPVKVAGRGQPLDVERLRDELGGCP